jgi:hypothetical protein
MKNTAVTIIIALFGVAILGALAVLLLSPAPSTPMSSAAKSQAEDAETTTSALLGEETDWDSDESVAPATGDAGRGGDDGVSLVASGDAVVTMSSSQRAAVETTIYEAMSTYSAEGVPALQPLLTHADSSIRSEAIEAMKQLDTPEAVVALRAAAKEEKDPDKRRALLEAADFVELPPLIGTPR